jgi:hypothetical protein
MKIRKSLCSLEKDDIKDNIEDVVAIVSNAKFICRKCARSARDPKHLCKPVTMEVPSLKKK